MTFSLPRRSSVYLIFALIDCLPPSPIAGAKDSDDVVAVREANRQHSALDSTKAVVPLLAAAVREVLCDHTAWICERKLSAREGDAVLPPVLLIFVGIPLEPGDRHSGHATT